MDRMFSYSPLSLTEKEIRLLVIQPCDNPKKVIKGKIVHANLESNFKYEALSYTWGGSNDTKTIFLDGKSHQVRENLELALRRLRLKQKPRIVWADAICINQNDTLERNHQVNQMALIYRQAQRVVIWLGTEKSNSRMALNFLRELMDMPMFVYGHDTSPNSRAKWAALAALCSREYWNRLWIIQEVILAADITIYCGTDQLEWVTFSSIWGELDTLISIDSYWREPTLLQIHRSLAGQLMQRRKDFRLSRPRIYPLIDLVDTFHEARCSDNRDKIFGLLSLAQSCCRDQITVDYSKRLSVLCRDVLRHHFLHHLSSVDPRDVIKLIRRIYLAVQGALPRFRRGQSFSLAQNICLVPVMGTIKDPVKYLSPSLDVLKSADISHLGDPRQLIGPYLLWKLKRLKAPHERKGILPLDVGVVQFISEGYLPGDGARHIPKNYSFYHPFMDSCLSSEECTEIIWFLMTCARNTSRRSWSSCKSRLFLGENGTVGFAAGETRIGDLICQFEDSNVLVVVRPENSEMRVIGTAVCLKREGEDSIIESMAGQSHNEDVFLTFYLSIETLQILAGCLL
jgi:Heterokaryon incompatibility protein (HET)